MIITNTSLPVKLWQRTFNFSSRLKLNFLKQIARAEVFCLGRLFKIMAILYVMTLIWPKHSAGEFNFFPNSQQEWP